MQRLWIGIDVAKHSLEVCAFGGESAQASFGNDAKGRRDLLLWLRQTAGQCEPRVCMEATGSYHMALACELCEAGFWVSVLNPRSVKHFAISLGSRNKNDAVDARLIARFGSERDPRPWSLAHPVRRQICQILGHMERMDKSLRIHQNALEDLSLPQVVLESSARILANLRAERQLMQQAVEVMVQEHEPLSTVVQVLCKVKGVGLTTAVQIAARLDVEAFESAEQAAAYAGLNPSQRHSGTSQSRTVLSKQGDAALRKALYFPAITAARFHPKLIELKDRLRAKNKRWSAIRCACMRKLLMICFGVAKRALAGLEPYYAT
jgi:transposase